MPMARRFFRPWVTLAGWHHLALGRFRNAPTSDNYQTRPGALVLKDAVAFRKSSRGFNSVSNDAVFPWDADS